MPHACAFLYVFALYAVKMRLKEIILSKTAYFYYRETKALSKLLRILCRMFTSCGAWIRSVIYHFLYLIRVRNMLCEHPDTIKDAYMYTHQLSWWALTWPSNAHVNLPQSHRGHIPKLSAAKLASIKFCSQRKWKDSPFYDYIKCWFYWFVIFLKK